MLNNWFQHIEFAYPWVFTLLIVLPILIYEYILRNQKSTASLLVTTTHFIKQPRTLKNVFFHFPFVLRCLAIVCLVVALARPREMFTEEQNTGEGIDIVLCFDISGSMTEKDFLPNRLEAAKAVAAQFVAQRPGDRIGIIIFSNLSFTLCPVTIDHNAVLAQIDNIQSGYLQDEGTAVGSGLATSVDRLRNNKTKTKIVVLLTDGVDFGGTISPDVARDMAKAYGIKVYTIGVGSEKEIEETVDSPFGPVTQKKKLEYNEGLLQMLAQTTGGQYFHATDENALQKVYASINSLEKSKIQVTTFNRYTDEYFPWLMAALSLLILEMILRYSVFRKFP